MAAGVFLKFPLKTMKSDLIFSFIISAYAIFSFHPLLMGFPKGGDAPFHLSMVRFLERNWPHIPRWDPRWGLGYPYLTFYQPLGTYLTFFLARILHSSIFDAYKIISFCIVLFSSLGLYFFVRINSSSNIVALTSSILYLSTPCSFNQLSYYGLYAEFIGYPFLLWTLTFFALYQRDQKKKYLLATIINYVFVLLSHSMLAIFGTFILVFYSIWLAISQKTFKKNFFNLLKILFLGASIVAFWYLPFISLGAVTRYSIRAPTGPLTLKQILGLGGSGPLRLAPWTILLALIGAISVVRKRRFILFVLPLSLFFSFYLIASHWPNFLFIYGSFTYPVRFLPWSSMFLSILGGYGLDFVIDSFFAVFNVVKPFGRGKSRYVTFFLLLSLIIPTSFWMREEQKKATNHFHNYELTRELASKINGGRRTAISSGGIIQTFNLISDGSQVYNYQRQSAPNLKWLDYSYHILFGTEERGEEVANLVKWFGVEHVVSHGEDFHVNYDEENFMKVWNKSGIVLLRYLKPTEHVLVNEMRRILVIADEEGFGNFFWTLLLTDFDPEAELMVSAGGLIDDHQLRELQRFDVVVVYGYSFRDRVAAWKMLEEYVESGGSLLIDTGYSPDSDADGIPEPSPVSRTESTDFGKTWNFTYVPSEIVEGIDLKEFSPPIYGEFPWGVSCSFNESIRENSRPLLWLDGHPIMVEGEYGEGRVVWCGLNLPYHAKSYDNVEEARLLLRILDWLKPRRERLPQSVVRYTRPLPEKIVIEIEDGTASTGLFLKETYFQCWHASILFGNNEVELKVYQAGPGLMYIAFPEEITYPCEVVFRYEIGMINDIGYLISLSTIIAIILYIVYHHVRPFLWIVRRIRSWLK